MNSSRKVTATAILATWALSLCLLGGARVCRAQATDLPNGEYQRGPNDLNSTAVANAPEPSAASQAKPSAQTSSDTGWHVAISPYLWLSGVNGTVGARGHETSVHASVGDVLSNFDIGILAAADIRYNRIVMPVDFMWMKLSDLKGLPFEEGTTSVKAKLNEDILTPKIGYRVIDKEKFKVDGLVGFRYWHLGTTLTLQSNTTSDSFYQAQNWVDAVGGARIQVMLTPKVLVTILGDAGGGGANSDYQVAGLFGFKLKKVVLQAGWRYLHVNYRPSSGFVDDVGMSGFIMGVTIPLK